jgi:hypothetical protein
MTGNELVIGAPAERTLATYLRGALGALDVGRYPFIVDVKVGTKYPPGAMPGRYVRLRRSGGTRIGVAETAPRIDYQVWYFTDGITDDEGAASLAELVLGLVYQSKGAVVDGVRIGQSTEFIGPGRFDDPINSAREIILFTVETRLRAQGA